MSGWKDSLPKSKSKSSTVPPYGDIITSLILDIAGWILHHIMLLYSPTLCCDLSITSFCTAILNLLHFLFLIVINQQLSNLLFAISEMELWHFKRLISVSATGKWWEIIWLAIIYLLFIGKRCSIRKWWFRKARFMLSWFHGHIEPSSMGLWLEVQIWTF